MKVWIHTAGVFGVDDLSSASSDMEVDHLLWAGLEVSTFNPLSI